MKNRKRLEWVESGIYTDLWCDECHLLHMDSWPRNETFWIKFDCVENTKQYTMKGCFKTYGDIMTDFEKLFREYGYTIARRNKVVNQIANRDIEK